LDSLFCNGWKNERSELFFTAMENVIFYWYVLAWQVKWVLRKAMQAWTTFCWPLAPCVIKVAHIFLTFKKVSWVWHHEELTQGNIRVEKFVKDASNHKHKNNQPISILASCLVVVK
jgi:hypothetical protein